MKFEMDSTCSHQPKISDKSRKLLKRKQMRQDFHSGGNLAGQQSVHARLHTAKPLLSPKKRAQMSEGYEHRIRQSENFAMEADQYGSISESEEIVFERARVAGDTDSTFKPVINERSKRIIAKKRT